MRYTTRLHCRLGQFQQRVTEVLGDLEGHGVASYIDDLGLYATTFEEYWQRLRTMFERLDSYDIRLNGSKCQFGQKSMDFLGHRVSKQGVEHGLAQRRLQPTAERASCGELSRRSSGRNRLQSRLQSDKRWCSSGITITSRPRKAHGTTLRCSCYSRIAGGIAGSPVRAQVMTAARYAGGAASQPLRTEGE